MCISDCMEITIFYLGRFLKKFAVNQCSSITKGSIYHIKHNVHTTITTGVDWPEIGCLMEVSVMFDICTYYILTLYGRNALLAKGMWKHFVYSLNRSVYAYLSSKSRKRHVFQQPHDGRRRRHNRWSGQDDRCELGRRLDATTQREEREGTEVIGIIRKHGQRAGGAVPHVHLSS